MRLLPALRQAGTRPANHKEHPLCRWCHRSLTEETGPPLPPPEPLPDVSTATPCRPASVGLTSSCPIFVRARSSVHNMEVHARRAQPGVPIVEEVLAGGCLNGATVFLTGASRAGRHRKCRAYQRGKNGQSTSAGSNDNHCSSATASSQTPRAAYPSTKHGILRFIHCGNAFVVESKDCDCLGLPSMHDGPYETECLPLLYGQPLRYSLIILAADNEKGTETNYFCDEYWLHFPWTNNPRGVRGSLIFHCCFAFVLLCTLHLLMCVRTLREGCRHDGPLSPYVHAVEPCVPLLFASPLPSVCWC
ncbi:hypothetical protein TCDM_11558 [Trypanosoma cruzi Dm28c]|uniref:Uncharacterized protein n=1 Tax=Trypanosoma cruzi Dm28c TaxID=1416333 RepID=V5B4I1_TRYCR|nr:hypothetical protein TCDM_11558 [Trypanosoma cruzi Dm28c]